MYVTKNFTWMVGGDISILSINQIEQSRLHLALNWRICLFLAKNTDSRTSQYILQDLLSQLFNILLSKSETYP